MTSSLGRGVLGELSAEGGLGDLASEVVEQLGGGDEEDGVAGNGGLVGEVLGDHGLAQAVGAEQHEVAALLEEVEGRARVR